MRGQGLPLNTIVIAAIGIIVAIIVAVAFVPGMGDIFGSIGGVSGTGDQAFLSECSTRCTNLDYKYSSVSVVDAAARNNFCNYRDADGRGCQYYMECLIHLSGGGELRRVQKITSEDTCMITAAGCTVACSLDSDCDDSNDCTEDTCQNPTTCNAQCSSTLRADHTSCNDDTGECCAGNCCLSTFGDCCSGACVADGTPPNCDGNCGGAPCGSSCCTDAEMCCSGVCAAPGTAPNCDGSCGGLVCLGSCCSESNCNLPPCATGSSSYQCNPTSGACECWNGATSSWDSSQCT